MPSHYHEPTPEELDTQAVDLLNDWPDGTPKSFSNGFTAHMDGEPSSFSADRIFRPFSTGKSASQTAVETREQSEADGKNIGTIPGLSARADASTVDPRTFHVRK